jgi:hypothetical protein
MEKLLDDRTGVSFGKKNIDQLEQTQKTQQECRW